VRIKVTEGTLIPQVTPRDLNGVITTFPILGRQVDTALRALALAVNRLGSIDHGLATATTDGTNGDITIAHGLGETPSHVIVCFQGAAFVATCQAWNLTATAFNVRCWNTAGAALTSTSVTVSWLAFV